MGESLSPQDGPGPDIMNDPMYATNTMDGEDGLAEADTCRICRGEGSDSEALFHPCKCSGSIKYVHQDCLMEWLSHSQKKHCELCKTPFRFTKLYSPNMPQSLPLHLLFRHIVLHTVENLATWLRFCLVSVVWLACLPFAIRQVWKLLFWLSDGGWQPHNQTSGTSSRSLATQALDMASSVHSSLKSSRTSPVSPLEASQTTPATLAPFMDRLAHIFVPYSGEPGNANVADPLAGGFLRILTYGLGFHSVVPQESSSINTNTSSNHISTSSTSTLLSEVQFLKGLTRSPPINQLIITIAEGYVITILLVICFILVLLIREWVVQQQPGINMGAGVNADFANPDRLRDAHPEHRAQQREEEVGEEAQDDIENRPIARPRRRNIQLGDNLQGAVDDIRRHPTQAEDGQADQGAPYRPLPMRDALSPAAAIQRRLTEETRMTEEFVEIWRRADGDPREVLRIIEEEGKSDEMRYWVNSMKNLQRPESAHDGNSSSVQGLHHENLPDGVSDTASLAQAGGVDGNIDRLREQAVDSDKSSASSGSWIDLPATSLYHDSVFTSETDVNTAAEDNENTGVSKIDKGKGREYQNFGFESLSSETLEKDGASLMPHHWDPISPNNFEPPLLREEGSTSRPRSISDGYPTSVGMSALANNSWSLNALAEPEEFSDAEPRQAEGFAVVTTGAFPVGLAASPKRVDDLELASSQGDNKTVQKAVAFDDRVTIIGMESENDDREGATSGGSLGLFQTPDNWEDEADTYADSSGTEDDENINHPLQEPNPFDEDTPLPAAREPIALRPVEPRGLFGNLTDFLWGDVLDQEREVIENDEHIVQDLAAEAPFVPVGDNDHNNDAADGDQPDQEVIEAALAAGIDPNDPDAIDDVDDFEGIMDLVGMRGPIFGLFQNAIFSILLLSLTIAFGVWIPYNIGRVSLLLFANPGPTLKLPLRLVFGWAALIQDLALSILGVVSFCLIYIASFPFWVYRYIKPTVDTQILMRGAKLGKMSLEVTHESIGRIADGVMNIFTSLTDSEIFAFSAASHEALIGLRSLFTGTFTGMWSAIVYVFAGDYAVTSDRILDMSSQSLHNATYAIKAVPSFLAKPDTWVISLEVPKRSKPLDLALSVWGGMDRFWATVAGYTTLCLAGALYVKKGTSFSAGQAGRDWEATFIDVLNQAGGVMKVILIISIEMLVFPLYCGLLLDAALLPLFEGATITSRFQFTVNSPLTSIFVHWFVGTCYMFHFALFVSMCRKIMRKGVLYFIRDPDDPTFHPVRDVLERNVATQLRKILFSALVYGALVVICLGGVVWGLAFACRGVLPIHWSSNEPVLEFPIDLLFYNFLMPLAVKLFKPSDGLHSMYSWWFRKCARMLRLTWFMFDERRRDEEGHTVHRSWKEVFIWSTGDPEKVVTGGYDDSLFKENPELKSYICHDGRYVRAPASDQVRIPKGTQIFLTVDAENQRVDGKRDKPDGIHGANNALFKHLYIPPWFRLRICVFIFSIWIFAALTGVSITIIPLVFGRYMFAKVIPPHVRKNDVYAFSIGVYILGSALYAMLHVKQFISYLRSSLYFTAETPQNLFRRATSFLFLAGRITWTYTAFLLLLPTLFSLLVELYFIIPMHTYFAMEERHIIHFVQSWTLGLLYVKLTTRIILWHEDSRPAQSLRAITRNGYLNPDARLATRSFLLPVGFVLSVALLLPWSMARIATTTLLKEKPHSHMLVYRYTYPLTLGLACLSFGLYMLGVLFKGWRMTIRDEVYLIGERLHNFGDRKSSSVTPPSLTRIDT